MSSAARPAFPAPFRRWRSGWLATLALVVFYCSLLGSIHGVAHAATTQIGAHAAAAGTQDTPRWTDRLFGHQAGDQDCGLYDEIISDVGLLPPAIPLPEVPKPRVLATSALLLLFHPVWQSAFEARAPPARH
jgi:hypothetical protein